MANLNEVMTALADEIRELSGTTTAKSVATMISDVDAANTEINEQTDLIAQITTALEGKAAVPRRIYNILLQTQAKIIIIALLLKKA